jgi:cell fate regulator YaaT (PSP1 superfamily)
MTQQAEPVQDKPQPPKPLIAVRYGYLGWVGEFKHDPALKLQWSDRVVIKTERGLEIATPVAAACPEVCPKCVRPEQKDAYVRASGEEHLQRGAGEVIRIATAEDLAEQRRIDAGAKEKMDYCQRASAKVGLDMRMIACEHLLGGERIIFYFTAEGRIDFRQLVRDLAREYHTRIEMRQIGARDEARIVADFEICGRECCCKNFLKVLRPVNMKMAKLQKATLDPTKVSGRCGRLRCCLRYEQLTYEELDAKLPGYGVRVRVEQGIGFIRDRQVITQILVLDMGEGRRLAVPLEEIQEILAPGEPGQIESRMLLHRRPSGSEAGGNGDTPVSPRPRDESAETPVVGTPGAPATDGDTNRPPRRDRDASREGGNGRPPRRPQGRPGPRGDSRSQGAGRGERRGPEARNEPVRNDRRDAPRNTERREPGPDNAPPSDRAPADSSPPADPQATNPQGRADDGDGTQGPARSGRRRRRRGRRGRADGPPRGDGQSPRGDNNPPPPQ